MEQLSPIQALASRELRGIDQTLEGQSGTDVVGKLRDVLKGKVLNMLEQHGMLHPPFDPFSIQRIGNARIKFVRVSRSEIGAQGSTEAVPEGFLVKVDKGVHGVRARSTAAHELMHTFFFDTTSNPPVRLGTATLTRKQYLQEEEVCNSLMREFLVPSFSLANLLFARENLRNPTIEGLRTMRTLYDVSSDIVAYRLITDLGMWDAVFMKYEMQANIFKVRTRLKSKSRNLFRAFKIPHYLSSNSSVGLSGTLYQLARDAEKGRAQKSIQFEGKSLQIGCARESVNPETIIMIAS